MPAPGGRINNHLGRVMINDHIKSLNLLNCEV